MGDFQMFMFDNFVIVDENEVIKKIAPEAEEAEEIVEAEVEELPEEPAVGPEPVEPPEKTYTQDELDSAVTAAEQKGYEKGFRLAQEDAEKGNTALLGNIDAKLAEVVINAGEMQKQIEQQYMALNRAVFQKLLPDLLEEQCVEVVNKFIADNFANFRTEAKLSFFLNPEVIGRVQEQIAKMAHIHDFEGKIALHKDEKLAKADCRIEWENGGVEHLSNKLLEKVDNLLEDNAAKN